jgi:hypothetical protein
VLIIQDGPTTLPLAKLAVSPAALAAVNGQKSLARKGEANGTRVSLAGEAEGHTGTQDGQRAGDFVAGAPLGQREANRVDQGGVRATSHVEGLCEDRGGDARAEEAFQARVAQGGLP